MSSECRSEDSSRCPYSYRIGHVRQARVPALLGQAKRVRAHIRARQAQSQSLSLPFNSHRQPLRSVLSSFQHPADKMPTRFSKTRKQWVCPVLPLPLPLPWEKKKKRSTIDIRPCDVMLPTDIGKFAMEMGFDNGTPPRTTTTRRDMILYIKLHHGHRVNLMMGQGLTFVFFL